MSVALSAPQEILSFAREVAKSEVEALLPLQHKIPDYFSDIVLAIARMDGEKVVVSGVGKSGLIAQKMVATFNSVGVVSSFLHGADALHGDLGILADGDILIVMSKSGENPELKSWIPVVRNRGKNKMVSIVGNRHSFLAKAADWVLDASVERETCPLDLAPTTSAVAQLIWGDILAASLIKCKGMTEYDFAHNHPGGMLGKKILLTCHELAKENIPITVREEENVLSMLAAISKSRIGAVAVVDETYKVIGIVTDGDFRRGIEKHPTLHALCVKELMTSSPITADESTRAEVAMTIMKANDINQLILVDKEKKYAGMVHLHQLLRAGFSS